MSAAPPVRRLRLMAEYHAHPLWDLDRPGDVDPAALPLSAALAARLRAWAAAYDRTLNDAYPPDSGFPDAAAEQAFDAEGRHLWQRVAQELGPGYAVEYRRAGD